MAKSRNEDWWNSIYDLPMFANESHYTDRPTPAGHFRQAWHLAESIQKRGNLTQYDLMQLRELLESAYALGVHDGAGNPYAG